MLYDNILIESSEIYFMENDKYRKKAIRNFIIIGIELACCFFCYKNIKSISCDEGTCGSTKCSYKFNCGSCNEGITNCSYLNDYNEVEDIICPCDSN